MITRVLPVWIETEKGELLDGWVARELARKVLEGGIPLQVNEVRQVIVDIRYKNLPPQLKVQNLWLKLA